MKVGDSFIADGATASSSECKAMAAARNFCYTRGWKFKGRRIEEGKIRIERIA